VSRLRAKRCKCGVIICRDSGHPRVQLFTTAFGQYLRERSDMPCTCFEVPAAGEDLFESDLLVVSEVVFGVATSMR
jgi:hypothetical protein